MSIEIVKFLTKFIASNAIGGQRLVKIECDSDFETENF